MQDKAAFRRKKRAEIRMLPEDYLAQSDLAITQRLATLDAFVHAERVFAYCSVGREVDTRRILALCLEQKKHVYLPVVLGGGVMEFALFEADDALRSGALNIPEPGLDAARAVPQAGDLILVPGLCFDAEKYRMGQGGGYYDRFLAGCAATSVGLGRERLMPVFVPREDYDLPVSILVTEARTMH